MSKKKLGNMARNHATVNYVEPNDVNAFQSEDGKTYSLIQPLEDYCIAMNIEVEVHSRETTASNEAGSQVIILSWESNKDGASHVNFMSGTRILKDGPSDNGQNPPYLTTDPTDMYLDDLIDHGTTEAIGIKSVDVSYDSGTVPVINVKMTDIRGLSMFQPNEMIRDASYQGVKGISADQVAQSFFQCFFRVPYPRFRLYIKGFYGKPVSYEMMCDKFDTNFNAATGDFDVTIHFIGFKYSFLTDVAFQVLAACPYSDYEGRNYWQSQIDNGRFKIPDIDGNLQNMPTLTEMAMSYSALTGSSSSDELQTSADAEETTHELEIARLRELRKQYENWYTSLYANICKVYGEDNCFLSKTPGENYDYLGAIILVQADANPDMASDFLQFDADFIKLHDDMCAAAKEEKEKHPGFKVDDISIDFSDYKKTKLLNEFYVNGAGEITYDGMASDSPVSREEVITRMLHNEDGSINKKRYTTIYNDGTNQRVYCYCIKNNYTYIRERINTLVADANRSAKETEDGTNTKEYNKKMFAELGYYPSVENFTKVMFAHLETFMHMMFELVKSVTGRTAEGLGISIGTDGNAIDVPSNSSTVPPFPRVTKAVTGDDGITTREDTWVGDFNQGTGFNEVDIVDGIFNGVETLVKLELNNQMDTTIENHKDAASARQTTQMLLPITAYDYFIATGGKIFNLKSHDLTERGVEGYSYKVLMRAFNVLGLNAYAELDGFDAEAAGMADGDNLYYEVGGKFENSNFAQMVIGTENDTEDSIVDKFFNDPSFSHFPSEGYYSGDIVGSNHCVPVYNTNDKFNHNYKSPYANIVAWDIYNNAGRLSASLSNKIANKLIGPVMFIDNENLISDYINAATPLAGDTNEESGFFKIKECYGDQPYFKGMDEFINACCSQAGKDAWKAMNDNTDPNAEFTFNREMLDYDYLIGLINDKKNNIHFFIPRAAVPCLAARQSGGQPVIQHQIEFTSFELKAQQSKWSRTYCEKPGNLKEALDPVLVTRPLTFKFSPLKSGEKTARYTGKKVDSGAVKSYLRGLVKRLRQLNNIGYQMDVEGNLVKQSSATTQTTDAMKMELYRYLKQVYDKWIPSTTEEDWKFEHFFDESTRQSKVYFIDSYYNKIGQKLLLSPSQIAERYASSMRNRDINQHMLGFISDIISTARCMLMVIQNFRDMTTDEGMKTMFKPIPYNEMGDVKRSPDFVIVYPYEPSKNLNLPNNDYNDDGFMLNDEFYTPVAITSRAQNTSAYYNMPAFGVSYGRQYQSYFKNVNVGMAGAVQTQQAIWAKHAILQEAAAGSQVVKDSNAQDLFDLYANQSYTCKVTMMGCAWVQPLMYFVLLNIPMFKGSYMIMKVEHRITPGDMTTDITACRMAKTSNQLVQDIFTQGTSNINGDNGGGYGSEPNYGAADTTNNCEYKVYPLTTNGKFKGDKPGPLFTGDQKGFCVALYHAWISAGAKPEIAEIIVAQEGYESGWGTSNLAKKFNYGGVRKGKTGWWEGHSIEEFVQAKINTSFRRYFSPFPLDAANRDEYLRILQNINGSNKLNAMYCTDPAGQAYIDKIMRDYYPIAHKHLQGVSTVPDNDPTQNQDIVKNLFEAIQKSVMATDNIKVELESGRTSSASGDILVIKQKNGKNDKLGKVFGLILNGYYQYIQELYWVLDENKDIQGNPVRIEVVPSLTPNVSKRNVLVSYTSNPKNASMSDTTFRNRVGNSFDVHMPSLPKTGKRGGVKGVTPNYDYSTRKWKPADITKQSNSLKASTASKVMTFTNEAYKRAAAANTKYINDDLIYALVKKYGIPAENDKTAISELPQFVNNGKFQSEIFKGCSIAGCGGNSSSDGTINGMMSDSDATLSGEKIGDWNVRRSTAWLERVSFKDYHKSPCPSIAQSDKWSNKEHNFPMKPECSKEGRCWGYVKRALIFDGFRDDKQDSMGTGPACKAGYDLKRRGFKAYGPYTYQGGSEKEPAGYQKQLGDIAIFKAQSGHGAGHAAMWCGNHWISDFKQYGNWITKNLTSTFTIWRYTGKGKNGGTA